MRVSLGWARLLLVFVALTSVISSALADEPLIDLDEYKGQVVVIDFWASWCVPCRRSFPWLDQMQDKYREHGLVVIGVNMDTDLSAARAFLEEYPVTFRILYDTQGDLARRYDVMAMPSSYVVNRFGDIAVRHLGFKVARTEDYEAALLAVIEGNETLGDSSVPQRSTTH